MFLCPFHADHDPSLAVITGNGESGAHWKCFGCGKGSDAIAWLKDYHRLTFKQAVRVLGSGVLLDQVDREPAYRAPVEPPGELWQRRADQLIERGKKNLWGFPGNNNVLDWPEVNLETGEVCTVRLSPLAWLLSRGLTEDTLKLWHIGYIPKDWTDRAENWGMEGKPVMIPEGILMPCKVGNQVWYLKIRRPSLKPKYGQVRGGRPAIYLIQTLEWQKDAVLCEGEFDALLLWQEAKDLAGVVSLGSAGAGLDLATWGLHLLNVHRWFMAYDLDASGQEGAERLSWLRSSKRLQVPKIRAHDKDLTDFYRSGGDLGGWIKKELIQN